MPSGHAVVADQSLLVVVDIDGTLAAPLPKRMAFGSTTASRVARWSRHVRGGAVHPLQVALAHAAALAGHHVVIVTSRGESLRQVTTAWLTKCFPMLADARLFMRRDDDWRATWVGKAEHLEAVRLGQAVVLLDDDAAMARALRRGDRFLRAPAGWAQLAMALAEMGSHAR